MCVLCNDCAEFAAVCGGGGGHGFGDEGTVPVLGLQLFSFHIFHVFVICYLWKISGESVYIVGLIEICTKFKESK